MIGGKKSVIVGLFAMSLHGAGYGQENEFASATFAGGCFWCMEPPFDDVEGVQNTTVGYAGGQLPNPSYDQVSAGGTGHAEVVQVRYDPDQVSYQELLDIFWQNVDPLDAGGQFCDRGSQYRSAIFAENERQLRLARQSKQSLQQSGQITGEIATEVDSLQAFYPAEQYHQNYYQKNSIRYNFYRLRCGRDSRLEELWQ